MELTEIMLSEVSQKEKNKSQVCSGSGAKYRETKQGVRWPLNGNKPCAIVNKVVHLKMLSEGGIMG